MVLLGKLRLVGKPIIATSLRLTSFLYVAKHLLVFLVLISGRGFLGVYLGYKGIESVNPIELNRHLECKIKAFIESPDHYILVVLTGFKI